MEVERRENKAACYQERQGRQAKIRVELDLRAREK